jgi:hypothetical protein
VRRLAGVLAVALAVGGCTVRDGGTPSAADYREAIGDALQVDRGDASLRFSDEQADCAAERIVEGIAPERLQDLDVGSGSDLTKLPFSGAEREIVFDVLRACVDLADQVAETIGRDAGLPEDVASCIGERYVATDVFREALLSPDFDPALNDRVEAALAEAMTACTTPD